MTFVFDPTDSDLTEYDWVEHFKGVAENLDTEKELRFLLKVHPASEMYLVKMKEHLPYIKMIREEQVDMFSPVNGVFIGHGFLCIVTFDESRN